MLILFLRCPVIDINSKGADSLNIGLTGVFFGFIRGNGQIEVILSVACVKDLLQAQRIAERPRVLESMHSIGCTHELHVAASVRVGIEYI